MPRPQFTVGRPSSGGGGFGGFGGGGFGGFGGLSSGSQQTAAALAGQVTVIADTDTNSLLVRTNPKNFKSVQDIPLPPAPRGTPR